MSQVTIRVRLLSGDLVAELAVDSSARVDTVLRSVAGSQQHGAEVTPALMKRQLLLDGEVLPADAVIGEFGRGQHLELQLAWVPAHTFSVIHDGDPVEDGVFRIMLLGSPRGGKTSLLRRFVEGTWQEHYAENGLDWRSKKLLVDDSLRVKVEVWSVPPGKEILHSMTESIFPCIQAFLIVFDLSDRNSFESVPSWLKYVNRHGCGVAHPALAIVGTKMDLDDERQVSTEEAKIMAEGIQLQYFETSAKLDRDVASPFHYAIASLVDHSRVQAHERRCVIF
mmetsp:Transcript_74411/g.206619  ORF Transcript_74411/g.206619 Transcript_74411/m.206619 type:complete len:281 (-) Transcript_74411:69-911(-)